MEESNAPFVDPFVDMARHDDGRVIPPRQLTEEEAAAAHEEFENRLAQAREHDTPFRTPRPPTHAAWKHL